MKSYLLFFLFLSFIGDNLNKAARVNNEVDLAQQYYDAGQYQKAGQIYRYLIDSLNLQDPELKLNLAHATFLNGENTKARSYYTNLAKSPETDIKSVAFTQLGILFFRQENPERALYHFRKALIQNPLNENARYNYELVQKYLNDNPKPTPPKKSQKQNKQNLNPTSARSSSEGNEGSTSDNTKQDETNPANKNAEGQKQNKGGGNPVNPNQKPNLNNTGENTAAGEKGNAKGISDNEDDGNPEKEKEGTEAANNYARQMQTLRARLRTTGLSPEKAAMLLEAMRQAELQYLQQVPKQVKEKPKKNLPDW